MDSKVMMEGIKTKTKMIIDTDGGVDDLLALLLACASPEVDLLAVITVAGNVGTTQATSNVMLLLRLLEKYNASLQDDANTFRLPPIISAGATQPLKKLLRTAEYFHGHDGVGGITSLVDESQDEKPLLYTTHPLSSASIGIHEKGGVEMMLEILRLHEEREVTIVTIGPMTNIALAAAIDRPTLERAKEIVLMGGAFNMPGNITPHAEYNMFVDPDAVEIALTLKVPLVFVPLNVTHQVKFKREEMLLPWVSQSAVARFVDHLTLNAMNSHEGMIHMHDPLAVVVGFDEYQRLTKRKKYFVKIDCSEEESGKTLLMESEGSSDETNGFYPAYIVTEVDVDKTMALFQERVLQDHTKK
jgi:inosine-uridine nucleoside N-ribohydrolase